MREVRRAQLELVSALAADMGASLSEVARQANVSTTTITRFVSSPNPEHVLSTSTYIKVQRLAANLGLSQKVADPPQGEVSDLALRLIMGVGGDGVTAPVVGESLNDPDEIAFVALWRRLKTNENRLRFLLAGFGLTGKGNQSGHG